MVRSPWVAVAFAILRATSPANAVTGRARMPVATKKDAARKQTYARAPRPLYRQLAPDNHCSKNPPLGRGCTDRNSSLRRLCRPSSIDRPLPTSFERTSRSCRPLMGSAWNGSRPDVKKPGCPFLPGDFSLRRSNDGSGTGVLIPHTGPLFAAGESDAASASYRPPPRCCQKT